MTRGIPKSGWLEDPVVHGLDCGDSSCRYAVNRGGMRTNGGCRCARNHGDKVERFLLRNYLKAQAKIDELQADVEVEKMLKE